MENRTAQDIRRLVELYVTPEFSDFISEEIENPFRATSNVRLVKLLDEIFMKDPGTKLELKDFDIEGEAEALHQLPNLLKTYVIQSKYEFGTDKFVDENIVYLIFRIVEGDGNDFRSFAAFELAFSKVKKLRMLYKRFEKHVEKEQRKNENNGKELSDSPKETKV